jgi:hypothetical protein
MNDDMFVCPRWDETLLNEIKTLNTHLFHISATVIEPRVSANHTAIAPYNYGETLATFQESKLLAEYADIKHVNWNGASWAPFVIHKTTWDLVGGFSIDFSPGIFAQHDLSMKLYRSGVRIFKGVSESRVYHFMSKSTAKVKKNNGKRQFLFKWGISAHAFYKEYLKMGDSYAPLPELIEGSRISRTRRFARFTQMVILLMNERR